MYRQDQNIPKSQTSTSIHTAISYAWIIALLFTTAGPATAEEFTLIVTVRDVHGALVKGIAVKADKGTPGAAARNATTNEQGRAGLEYSPGDTVVLQTANRPDLAIVVPRDKPIRTSGESTAVTVVVARRGDRGSLTQHRLVTGIVDCFLRNSPAQPAIPYPGLARRRGEAMQLLAQNLGLNPRELDVAIRAWTKTAATNWEKGLAALFNQRPEAARSYFAKLLREEKQPGPDNDAPVNDIADAAFYLGTAYFALGENWAAIASFEEARRLRPADGALLTRLGQALIETHENAEAELDLREALALDERRFGEEGGSSPEALDSLAWVTGLNTGSQEEESLYRRQLASRQRRFGPNHPAVAESLMNLAVTLTDRGRLAEAEMLANEALAIQRRTLGPESTEMGTALAVLGSIASNRGDLPKAEEITRHAVALRNRAFGMNHPYTAAAMESLANILSDQGENAEAEELQIQVLGIREKLLGRDSPDTATSLNNVATQLERTADPATEERWDRRALAIRERTLGPDNPATIESQANIGAALLRSGKPAAAEPYFRRSLETNERIVGANSPQVAADLNGLAAALAKQGKNAEAAELLDRAIGIYQASQSVESPGLAQALSNLAALRSRANDFAGAEALLRRALAIREKVQGPDNLQTKIARSALDAAIAARASAAGK